MQQYAPLRRRSRAAGLPPAAGSGNIGSDTTARERDTMTRIAIVTGASSGLGREFVRRIDQGEAGAVDEIWAIARRAERLEALVRTCGTPVRAMPLDLTDESSFETVSAALEQTPGAEISLLVNNAGFGTFGDFARQPADNAPRMVALLLRAPVELTYRALPYMAAGSRIINVASVAAFIPQPRLSVYSAAKRFVLDFSRSLDVELGEVGIHVTALCPKFMKTEFLDAPGDEGAAGKMTLIGFERADDVARAALAAARAGRSLCIPSLDMKALYAISRVAPYKLAVGIERALGII